MKIFQINGGVFGSTGKIMFGIANVARSQGHDVLCASPVTVTNRNKQPDESYIKIGSYYGRVLSVLLSRITGLEGCFSLFSTLKLLRTVKKYNPDVLHIHSIHNSYLNVAMLFKYIKKHNVKTVWTLHDCWAFTGHCPHYEMIDCDKWKTGCRHCPLYKGYPKSYFDNSRFMYALKKKWFCGVKDLNIITPSKWLADQVKMSFLKEYPVTVINSGIDLSVFKPTPSDFKEEHNIQNKKVVLGVAFGWDNKKGLDVFIDLAKRLDDSYQIVLVGTDDNVDKLLPDNIISIHRTENQQELAKIYTAADVFVNPTREEVLGLVNLEALACGTPVITFSSGGSPECLDKNCGVTVDKNDTDAIQKSIVCIDGLFLEENCILRTKKFNMKNQYRVVVDLYERL